MVHSSKINLTAKRRHVSRETKSAIEADRFLVWVYRVQKAHVIIGRGAGLQSLEREVEGLMTSSISADGCAQMAEALSVGAIIRGVGAANMSGDLHPDAEVAHRAVALLPKVARWLVETHATTASHPDWKPTACHRFEPSYFDDEGRRLTEPVVLKEYRNRHLMRAWCPVIERDVPERIEIARLAFKLWHASIVGIAEYLNAGRMVGHHITPPSIDHEPWNVVDLRNSA